MERTCGEKESVLPAMSLRGREIGGGTGVLLHENSVQKRFKERMEEVSCNACSKWVQRE